jgi:MYXO-CTERM domain-containing protein
VHANTLAVYEPGEFFPNLHSNATPANNVNDGGQRPLRRNKTGGSYPNPDLPTYLQHKVAAPYTDTADIKTFEQTTCHAYVACDVTNAYSSPGHVMNGNQPKVDEITRQFVYLPPDLLVIFDRIDALDPSYEKRFLLQTPDNPQVSGSDYTLSNGAGKLYVKTLLPAQPQTTLLTNFTVEGTPHPPNPAGIESLGSRLEVVPTTAQARDYFLHVLSTGTAAPTSTVTEDADSATLTIAAAQGNYTLRFVKNGPMAGHVMSQTSGQSTICDEELGGGASASGPDAGAVDDAAADDDGGADGGVGTKPRGCGCAVGGKPVPIMPIPLLGLALVGAGWLLRQRRKRRRAS